MTGRPLPSNAAIRAKLRKRLGEGATLRDLADEIGVAHSGLSRFLNLEESELQRAKRQLYVDWYHNDDNQKGPSREEIDAAVASIKSALSNPSWPRKVRERWRQEIIRDLSGDGSKVQKKSSK